MIEIEIKARIKSLSSTKSKILSLGAELISKDKQVDKIFGRQKDLDDDSKVIEGRFSARLRQKDDKILVEFKEINRSGVGMEFSSPVVSLNRGISFLQKLDYKEAFTVSKTRELFNLDGFEIALDEVDKLGLFIEIEQQVKDGKDRDKKLNECKQLLTKIDTEALIVDEKYGDLMQELINQEK